MAFIPWPNSVKVVLEFTVASIPVTVTIAVTKPSALEAGDVADVTAAVKSWAGSNIMPLLTNSYQLSRATGYDMTSSTGEVVIDTAGLPVTGSVTTEPVDIGSAMDISFRTPNRGRSGRGRNYVPGGAVAQRTNAASWTTTATNNMAGGYSNLNTAITATGFAHTVASEQLDGVVRNPAVMQSVTALIGNSAIANQRKRGLNSG